MGEAREECSGHGEESVQRPSDKKGADLEGGKESHVPGEETERRRCGQSEQQGSPAEVCSFLQRVMGRGGRD